MLVAFVTNIRYDQHPSLFENWRPGNNGLDPRRTSDGANAVTLYSVYTLQSTIYTAQQRWSYL